MSGYTLVALVIGALWALVMGGCVLAHREPRTVRPAQRTTLVGTDARGVTWAAIRTGPTTARLTRNGAPWVDALGRDTLARLTVRYGITWHLGVSGVAQ